jgi:hypothetical protein
MIGSYHFKIILELRAEKDIKIRTYGQEFSLGYAFDCTHVSCSTIDCAINFAETATPCLGQPLPAITNECLKVAVSHSKLISLAMPATGNQTIQNEMRLVSLCCTFLLYCSPNSITNIILCNECSSVYRIFKKRECKGKKAMDMGSQVFNFHLQIQSTLYHSIIIYIILHNISIENTTFQMQSNPLVQKGFRAECQQSEGKIERVYRVSR